MPLIDGSNVEWKPFYITLSLSKELQSPNRFKIDWERSIARYNNTWITTFHHSLTQSQSTQTSHLSIRDCCHMFGLACQISQTEIGQVLIENEHSQGTKIDENRLFEIEYLYHARYSSPVRLSEAIVTTIILRTKICPRESINELKRSRSYKVHKQRKVKYSNCSIVFSVTPIICGIYQSNLSHSSRYVLNSDN